MATKKPKADDRSPKPPRPLGTAGLSLWQRINSEYQIADAGGVELLALGCEALDRAESLKARIEADGLVIVVNGAPRDHPALKHELSNRAFTARCIQRLGLDVEPVGRVGRPGIGGYRG